MLSFEAVLLVLEGRRPLFVSCRESGIVGRLSTCRGTKEWAHVAKKTDPITQRMLLFILRFYVVHFNLGHGDELAHSGWAALGALIFGAPIYYFFRDTMQLTKSIPLAVMVLVGIGCYFLL